MGGSAFGALTLWVLGYPTQALERIRQALTWADKLSHPVSLAFDSSGVLYVSNQGTGEIKKVTPGAVATNQVTIQSSLPARRIAFAHSTALTKCGDGASARPSSS